MWMIATSHGVNGMRNFEECRLQMKRVRSMDNDSSNNKISDLILPLPPPLPPSPKIDRLVKCKQTNGEFMTQQCCSTNEISWLSYVHVQCINRSTGVSNRCWLLPAWISLCVVYVFFFFLFLSTWLRLLDVVRRMCGSFCILISLIGPGCATMCWNKPSIDRCTFRLSLKSSEIYQILYV